MLQAPISFLAQEMWRVEDETSRCLVHYRVRLRTEGKSYITVYYRGAEMINQANRKRVWDTGMGPEA